MNPLIKEGRDVITVSRKSQDKCCKMYDIVLFKRDNGDYVLHRILTISNGEYFIVGDNCISGENVREEQVIGIMTALIRDGKQYDLNSKKYWKYVKFWCAPYKMRFRLLKTRNALKSFLVKKGIT